MNHYEIAGVVAELRRASYSEGVGGCGSRLSAAIDAVVKAACVDHYVSLQEIADRAGSIAYEAQKCLVADGIGFMFNHLVKPFLKVSGSDHKSDNKCHNDQGNCGDEGFT